LAEVVSEFAVSFALRPISESSAQRFRHGMAVVASGPAAGAALAAMAANPAP